MMMRKASTGVWHINHIGTGIYNWLRAGQYENSGLEWVEMAAFRIWRSIGNGVHFFEHGDEFLRVVRSVS